MALFWGKSDKAQQEEPTPQEETTPQGTPTPFEESSDKEKESEEVKALYDKVFELQSQLRDVRIQKEQFERQVKELRERLNQFRNGEKEAEEQPAGQDEPLVKPSETEPQGQEEKPKTGEQAEPKKEESNTPPADEGKESRSRDTEELLKLMQEVRDTVEQRYGQLLDEQREMRKEKANKEERYEQLVSRVQEDRYRKDKVKILSRMIRMRSNITDMLGFYESEAMEGKDSDAAAYLLKQIKALIDGLDADLRQEMVIKMENGKPGSDLDEEHQEAVGTEPTDQPELAGKVCRSVSPGFYWTLPYIFKPRVNETGEEVMSYKFVINYEQVITYQYKKEQ